MRFLPFAVAALFSASVALAAPMERQIIGAEDNHSLAADGDCEHFFKTTFTTFPAQVSDQEQREIDVSEIARLRVIGSPEGGVSVRGWSRPQARLIVCRYAVGYDKQRATRLLDSIHAAHRNGEITAVGPPNDDTQAWWVNMILYVPRRATVDVVSSNGGVAIRNMSGNVTAHSTTGGISVAQSSGHCKITTESGGITLERVTGSVDASSRDGAIALKLPAADVPTIEARTAEAGHIVCTLKSCEDIGSWDANRQFLRIGGGVPHIRLSTSGAAITIAPSAY